MILTQILRNLEYEIIHGDTDIEISKVQYDSRKIKKGDVFLCITGYSTDGHKFVKNALENGAKAVICEREIEVPDNTTLIKVENSRKALALIAKNCYPDASKLKIIGVTGTSGKTTTTFLIKSILENSGHKCGLIGTILNYAGDTETAAHRTTPESLELFELFDKMVKNGLEYCVMEVSSHSLCLYRVYGINFCEGIFTNLSQDHLDFHKTFENYYQAKLKLFKQSSKSNVNKDDAYGKRVINDIGKNIFTYSINEPSDLKAENVTLNSKGSEFEVNFKDEREKIKINLPGIYNVMNSLSAASACLNEGISLRNVKRGLEAMLFVPGRCELASRGYNLDFDIIIDYAHTPNELEKILKIVREFTKGRVISVFGCGGDRDKAKRHIMGEIGTKLSDFAIITSDNPRSENPMDIIKDVVSGVKSKNYTVIENRKEAIKEAIKMAKKDDVVLLAGKGHENYQILKDRTIHFDEREIIHDIVKELF